MKCKTKHVSVPISRQAGGQRLSQTNTTCLNSAERRPSKTSSLGKNHLEISDVAGVGAVEGAMEMTPLEQQ